MSCERWQCSTASITAAIQSSEGTGSAEDSLGTDTQSVFTQGLIYYAWSVLVWVLLVTLALVFKIMSSSVTAQSRKISSWTMMQSSSETLWPISRLKYNAFLGEGLLLFCLVLKLKDPMWRDMQKHSTPLDREAHGPCKNSRLSARVATHILNQWRAYGHCSDCNVMSMCIIFICT